MDLVWKVKKFVLDKSGFLSKIDNLSLDLIIFSSALCGWGDLPDRSHQPVSTQGETDMEEEILVPYGSPDEHVPYEPVDHDWHDLGGGG